MCVLIMTNGHEWRLLGRRPVIAASLVARIGLWRWELPGFRSCRAFTEQAVYVGLDAMIASNTSCKLSELSRRARRIIRENLVIPIVCLPGVVYRWSSRGRRPHSFCGSLTDTSFRRWAGQNISHPGSVLARVPGTKAAPGCGVNSFRLLPA